MSMHGGFQGRTNKLVDGCYSFWQGGAFPQLEAALTRCGQLPAGGVSSLFSTDVRVPSDVHAQSLTGSVQRHAAHTRHACTCTCTWTCTYTCTCCSATRP